MTASRYSRRGGAEESSRRAERPSKQAAKDFDAGCELLVASFCKWLFHLILWLRPQALLSPLQALIFRWVIASLPALKVALLILPGAKHLHVNEEQERGEVPRQEDQAADALRQAATWTRYSTIGLQFALTPAMFGWLGHWLDQRFDWSPWGIVSGVVFGFVGASAWLYYKIYPYKG